MRSRRQIDRRRFLRRDDYRSTGPGIGHDRTIRDDVLWIGGGELPDLLAGLSIERTDRLSVSYDDAATVVDDGLGVHHIAEFNDNFSRLRVQSYRAVL